MKLAEYLKIHLLTHKKFAEMVGVTQPHITNILSGRKNASVALTKKIEEVTEGRVTFKDIFNTEAPSRLNNRKKKVIK